MSAQRPSRTSGKAGNRAKVTVKEVAALAGVSTGTVSNVLNHPDMVSADTVSRVNRAIEELGWIRHQGAGQIRGGRSAAVGVVVAEFGPHTIELLKVLENYLEAHGFIQQVVTSAYQPDREVERIELFEQQRVRGIIISPVQEYAPYLHRLAQLEIPLVLLGQESITKQLCSVSGDDEAGGRLAVQHLLETGHRRIAVVGGKDATHQVRGRIAGARQALAGGAELTVVETADHDIPAGIAAAQHLAGLRVDERPSAVLAINDSIAVGLQRGLQCANIRIPEDIAVVGYDDSELAQAAPVALTTVRVSNVEMGRHAAELLLDEIASNESGGLHVHRQVRLRPELVLRDSTDHTRPLRH
jgi:LacI family transcriptional regulator